jgi:acylphosphatase
MNENDGEV